MIMIRNCIKAKESCMIVDEGFERAKMERKQAKVICILIELELLEIKIEKWGVESGEGVVNRKSHLPSNLLNLLSNV